MLRRLKTEVEYSLPPKSEVCFNKSSAGLVPNNVDQIRVYVKMSEMQTFFYKSFLKKDFQQALNATGNDAFLKLLFLVMQLRKVCNHPFLFPGSEPEPIITGILN